LDGRRPSKPTNALELGLSDKVWKLLEECWQAERTLRPPVKNALDRVKAAASACGTLPPSGGMSKQCKDPESDFSKFGRSLPHSSSDAELIGFCRSLIPWHGP